MLAALILSLALIPFSGDYLMQIYRASIVLFFCTMLCHAQAKRTDQALLNQARQKYDAPFAMNRDA